MRLMSPSWLRFITRKKKKNKFRSATGRGSWAESRKHKCRAAMVLSLQSPGQPCFPSVVCADMQRTACQLALLAGPRHQVLTGLHHPRVTHCPWRGSTQPLRRSADTARPKVTSQHHASLAQGPEENKPYPPSGRTFQELREGLPEAESKEQASGGGGTPGRPGRCASPLHTPSPRPSAPPGPDAVYRLQALTRSVSSAWNNRLTPPHARTH